MADLRQSLEITTIYLLPSWFWILSWVLFFTYFVGAMVDNAVAMVDALDAAETFDPGIIEQKIGEVPSPPVPDRQAWNLYTSCNYGMD